MTEQEISQQQGAEVTALVNSFVTSGRQTAGNPQFIAELNVINQKYNALRQQAQQPTQQQQVQQQQTTTQDTGALANVGTDDGQDTQQKMLYGGDYSLENYAGGQPKLLYFTGSDGKSYVKRYAEDEYVYGGPPDGVTLQLTSIIAEKNDENFKKDVDTTKFNYGGKFTPEQYAEMTYQANKDDPSDNDIFYDVTTTDPVTGEEKTTTYVDVTGTGQSIPVGATNITRDPTQLGQYDDEGNFTEYDESTYTQPVLTKGFTSYYPQGDPKAELDTTPTPTTSFTEALTSPFVEGGTGSGAFDLGSYFGLDEEQLVLSNPDSNQFNLEKFFNQTEAMGTQNFLRSQSIDVLDDIINEGNFFKALAGQNFELPDGKGMYYDYVFPKMQEGGFQQPSYDADQLENFFDDLRESNRNPTTGDIIYSNTAFSTDPFNISGGDDTGPMMRDVYGKRPVYGEFFGGRRGGMWDRFLDSYLTRFGYNPQTFDELIQAVEQPDGSTLYYGADGSLINPASLEGVNLGDPIREIIGEENVLLGTQTLDPSGAVTSTTYTDIYDPEEDEKYFLDLLPT